VVERRILKGEKIKHSQHLTHVAFGQHNWLTVANITQARLFDKDSIQSISYNTPSYIYTKKKLLGNFNIELVCNILYSQLML